VQGLFLLDSGDAQIWNNTIIGGTEPVRIHDTTREAKDVNSAPYGYDKRRPVPDPTVTWVVFNIEMKNNLIGGQQGGWCGVFCILNDTDTRTGAQMIKLDGNIYQRTSATAPKELIRWASGKGGKTNYGSLSAFRSAVAGQEASGAEALTSVAALSTSLPKAGVAIPASVASVIGVPAGTVKVGQIG